MLDPTNAGVNSPKELSVDGWNVTEMVYKQWDGTAWLNSWRYVFERDQNGKPDVMLLEYWDGGGWVNSDKTVYSYDVNGALAEMVQTNWVTGAWVNTWRSSYVVNVAGDPVQELRAEWVDEGWSNSLRYSYNGRGNNAVRANTSVVCEVLANARIALIPAVPRRSRSERLLAEQGRSPRPFRARS